MMEGSGNVQIMTDPDPGGQKTYGSCRTGSKTPIKSRNVPYRFLFAVKEAKYWKNLI
jgi:hypothetical protein